MKEINLHEEKWFRKALKAIIPSSTRHLIRARHRRKQEKKDFLSNLRSTDVFLIGHPKSGNTWLAYMLGIVMQRNNNCRVNLANIGKFVPTIHAKDSQIALYEGLDSPRIFRNEGPLYPEFYPKTIYLIRDPRAVLLSYYHHCIHDTGEYQWPLEDFVDEMLTYGCIKRLEPYLIRWDQQILRWIDRSKHQPVKIIKYEDLISNRRIILEEVIDYLDISCNENDIAVSVERGDFHNMRQDEQTNGAESYIGEKGSRGYFVRRGKIDSWKDEMPKEIINKIERKFKEAMIKTGYLTQ